MCALELSIYPRKINEDSAAPRPSVCVKCNGLGVLAPSVDGSVVFSACDCEAGQIALSKHRPGNKAGSSLKARMNKVAFESTLDGVLQELHRLEETHIIGEMSYYEAVCRALMAQALHGVDEGTRLRAIQYIIDRKLGRAAQSVQVQKGDDFDPFEGMSDEERRELLAIALAG